MKINDIVRIAIVAAAPLATLVPLQAWADYPDHPITLVVPSGAGGSLDIMARVLAPVLTKDLGQPVIVENKPGGDAIIGIEYVVNAAPDGYTLLLSGGAETIAPALHSKLGYDPMQLAAISEFAATPNMVVVNSKLPVNTLADLVAYARKNPDRLNAAATGNGSRLSIALFELKSDTRVETISFGGGSEANTSLLSGETDFTIQDSLSFAGVARSPSLRLIAVTDTKRLTQMPDVPTTAEAGLPGFTVATRYGIYTGVKVSKDILQKLNAEMTKISTNPDVVSQFYKLNLQIYSRSVDDSQAGYVSQMAAWKNVVQQEHIPMSN